MATGRFDLSNLQFRGRVGDLVFLPQPNGRAIVRRMPTKPPRRTALQEVAAERVTLVAAVWKALTQEEGEAWNRYAENPHPALPQGGGSVPRRGYNAFLALSTKRLQMFPDEPLPRLPPTSAFLGDGIVIVAQASVPLPQPPFQDEPLGEGAILFSASGPNAAGVVTELLVQPLKSLHRKPLTKEYKSRGFVAFAGEPVSIPCEPGPYACAIRFVRTDTGQETAIVPLGKVVV
jgi:hypothetical protein